MPRRKDIKRVLVIGSGPEVIGQGGEFDYAGLQACKALKEEGIHTILVSGNPSASMTDTEAADAVYIEPLTVESVAEIIRKEKPNAILPTVGGRTALNLAYFLMKEGALEKYGVESIGCDVGAASRAEDRELFREAMREINVKTLKGGVVTTVKDGMATGRKIGFPVVLRPSRCPEGAGVTTARNGKELETGLAAALRVSPMGKALVEQSVQGWKEIEFEVMRDRADNVIVVATTENLDPMGVHTGDSAAVLPSQTVSARERADFVNLCRKIIRKAGVSGGGANIQFAQNPEDGEAVVIEVNPRFTRSSALASKATGFPIARVSAKLSVGITLPEVANQVTGCTMAFAEPAVDYCVFRMGRFAFDEFPRAERALNTSMKAVGEAMAIGRNFREALQKGIRSTETGRFGLGADGRDAISDETLKAQGKKLLGEIKEKIRTPSDERLFYIRYGLKAGMTCDEIYKLSGIDRWFIDDMRKIVELENEIKKHRSGKETDKVKIPPELLLRAKASGFSDVQIAFLLNTTERKARAYRKQCGIKAVYKPVDTCAGEFSAESPYYYSTYETENESVPSKNKKILILGGGPDRIGQGGWRDYCCRRASAAVREEGFESIIVNCNPRSLSTDYDAADKLYFEPLTVEDVLGIVELEKPVGVMAEFGGLTSRELAAALEKEGVKMLGTGPEAISLAGDRAHFAEMLLKLKIPHPENGTSRTLEKALKAGEKIGYPLVVRRQAGGKIKIIRDSSELEKYFEKALTAAPESAVHIEKFIEDAIEVDVDAVGDGKDCVIGGILEHIERAGIHSGDSAMTLPPQSLSGKAIETIGRHTHSIAKELKVRGLLNVRFAVKDGEVYVLGAAPGASRTVPFVSKAAGVPLVDRAVKIMLGQTLKQIGFTEEKAPGHVAVREPVFPFSHFPGDGALPGLESKSTGEAMGIGATFAEALAKSWLASGRKPLKKGNNVLISVRDRDKSEAVHVAKKLDKLGFKLLATSGTAEALKKGGLKVKTVPKLREGAANIAEVIKSGKAGLLIVTPSGGGAGDDEAAISSAAVASGVSVITTIAGAKASVGAIEFMLRNQKMKVKSLQEYRKEIK